MNADKTRDANRPIVFVGGPFKAHVDSATGLLDARFRQRYERMIAFFESHGCTVLNAHQTEGWGGSMVSAAECTERDYRWMEACDLFVAFPGDPVSPGTHVEIGWASAMRRPTVLLLEPGGQYAALVTGLGAVAPVAYLEYDAAPGFLARLGDTISTLLANVGARWALRAPPAEQVG
jgi:hypothetical protein